MSRGGLGLAPDTNRQRLVDAAECPLDLSQLEGPTDVVVQPVPWIRDQRDFPSCVGQAFAAAIDAHTLQEPWASAVGIWREARRRQGRLEQIERGTRSAYAVEGLVHRGWDPFVQGEDLDPVEAGQQDDLQDELFAHDKRMPLELNRYRIVAAGAERLEAVDAALFVGLGVVLGSGTRRGFGDIATDELVTSALRGGDRDGHAERVAGMWRQGGRRRYLVQGSWGVGFAGCHAPSGVLLAGCYLADESVIVDGWDLHCIDPKV